MNIWLYYQHSAVAEKDAIIKFKNETMLEAAKQRKPRSAMDKAFK